MTTPTDRLKMSIQEFQKYPDILNRKPLEGLLRSIIEIRQQTAILRRLGDLYHQDYGEHARYIENAVKHGLRVPQPQVIPTGLIFGTSYQGESDHFYSDWTPKDVNKILEELDRYLQNGCKIDPIMAFAHRKNGANGYLVIDGHGRTSFANCVELLHIPVLRFE